MILSNTLLTITFRILFFIDFLAVYSYTTSTFLLSPAPSAGLINSNQAWRSAAIRKLLSERQRMNYTPLVEYQHPYFREIKLYLKNEGASTTGSLKHRFAWALFMWGLTDGHIKPETTVYEASSGNTATSESYMAQLIGVRYVAVVGTTTEQSKIQAIQKYGGTVITTNRSSIEVAAEEAAKDPTTRFFINQYANAERAEEFFESGDFPEQSTNVLHEILRQISGYNSNPSDLRYFVAGAGTGGTMTSVGRYVNRYNLNIACVLADIQYSAFFDWVLTGHFGGNETGADQYVPPGIPGVGFLRLGPLNYGVTTSLLPSILTEAVKVPDLGTVAAMMIIRDVTGVTAGPSSGTNFLVTLHKAVQLRAENGPQRNGSIATILCDNGDLYLDNYYNRDWIDLSFKDKGGVKALDCYKEQIENAMRSGVDPLQTFGVCVDNFQQTATSRQSPAYSSSASALNSNSVTLSPGATNLIQAIGNFLNSIFRPR